MFRYLCVILVVHKLTFNLLTPSVSGKNIYIYIQLICKPPSRL